MLLSLAAQGKTFEQALDSFTQATHSVLTQAGKTPVVWEGKLVFPCGRGGDLNPITRNGTRTPGSTPK